MRLAGLSILVLGRLAGMTRARLERLVLAQDAKLLSAPGAQPDVICLAHSSAAKRLSGVSLVLPVHLAEHATVLSEGAFRRALGIGPPASADNRALDRGDLARQSRLPEELIRALALYDVLQPVDSRYGYRDLIAAREVARLLKNDMSLSAIVQADLALRRAGSSLSNARLRAAPWGGMAQEVAGRLASLNGQFEIPLFDSLPNVDELFELAEVQQAAGDLAAAEASYRSLLDLDRRDPVAPFNLGIVLESQERRVEAARAYMQAVTRDPAFADGWVNLGVVRREEGKVAEAEQCYLRALEAEPDHAAGLFNLGLLLTDGRAFTKATAVWDRFMATKPPEPDRQRALRLATLCRLEAMAG